MPAHEPKNCPRCGTAFECRVGNITRCQCQVVTIPEEVADELQTEYGDCLCADCLKELVSETTEA
ncbi:MAG: cysteine-rich CWC family protein [Pseudomonadota bacterium]